MSGDRVSPCPKCDHGNMDLVGYVGHGVDEASYWMCDSCGNTDNNATPEANPCSQGNNEPWGRLRSQSVEIVQTYEWEFVGPVPPRTPECDHECGENWIPRGTVGSRNKFTKALGEKEALSKDEMMCKKCGARFKRKTKESKISGGCGDRGDSKFRDRHDDDRGDGGQSSHSNSTWGLLGQGGSSASGTSGTTGNGSTSSEAPSSKRRKQSSSAQGTKSTDKGDSSDLLQSSANDIDMFEGMQVAGPESTTSTLPLLPDPKPKPAEPRISATHKALLVLGITWCCLWSAVLCFTTYLLYIGCCLHGDSMITMADRSQKKIKYIKAGDKILALSQGKTEVKTVVEVKVTPKNIVRSITLKPDGGDEFVIKATDGHPFCVEGKGWAVLDPTQVNFDADKIKVWDRFVLFDGKGANVVRISEPIGDTTTFNLIIDGPGAFFAENIVTHSGLV